MKLFRELGFMFVIAIVTVALMSLLSCQTSPDLSYKLEAEASGGVLPSREESKQIGVGDLKTGADLELPSW